MKTLFASFLFFVFLTNNYAQSSEIKVTLSGYIKDSANGESIVGANVKIEGTELSATSNVYGFYSLSLAAGTYSVIVNQSGFTSSKVNLSITQNLTRNFELSKVEEDFKGVSVKAKKRENFVEKVDMSTNNLNITQIPIDLENLSELTSDDQAPYEHFISKTGQSLLICDDFETDSKLETMVYKIINSVLRVGRASRIYCLIISHALCNGKKSKVFFQEVDSIVIFPKSISPYTAKYMLSNYTTMDSKGADKLLNSTSRWVYIHKSFPHYVIESNRMWLY